MSLTIARYTLIEAFRSRTIVLLACALAAALALAFFLRLVAITEVEQVQAVIIAALGRLCAVFLLAVLVVGGLNGSGLFPYARLTLNPRVFLYGLLLTLFFGVLSGVYPAWRMSRLNPVDALKGALR